MRARRILLELFDAALRAVDGRECVARFLRTAKLPAPIEVFAIGKAASAMARGAIDALGPVIGNILVITKDGHVDPELMRRGNVTLIESAHPVPDERSLAAGAELVARVRALRAEVLPLFLVSGGSSSLVEQLNDGATLEDLRALNVRGLAAGWNIATLNAERARLSQLKAGGVARLLGRRRALALFISDVPGDDPNVIGSGLLGPGLLEPESHGDAIERHVVANAGAAVRAVADAAHAHGLTFESLAAPFDGEAADVAHRFVDVLRASSADGVVWGGESTVTLPAMHGQGGRNTHLALAAARLLRAGEPLLILAAGTDGTDGPTSDAGAIVDAGSLERAELAGVDVERAFLKFDSGPVLEAAEDLVHTGPTGTNVGDILIGLKQTATSMGDHRASRVL